MTEAEGEHLRQQIAVIRSTHLVQTVRVIECGEDDLVDPPTVLQRRPRAWATWIPRGTIGVCIPNEHEVAFVDFGACYGVVLCDNADLVDAAAVLSNERRKIVYLGRSWRKVRGGPLVNHYLAAAAAEQHSLSFRAFMARGKLRRRDVLLLLERALELTGQAFEAMP